MWTIWLYFAVNGAILTFVSKKMLDLMLLQPWVIKSVHMKIMMTWMPLVIVFIISGVVF